MRTLQWCHTYGVCLNAWALPYLQTGPVPYKTFGFLQYSFNSFSISRRYIIDGPGDNSAVGDLPPWHSSDQEMQRASKRQVRTIGSRT